MEPARLGMHLDLIPRQASLGPSSVSQYKNTILTIPMSDPRLYPDVATSLYLLYALESLRARTSR